MALTLEICVDDLPGLDAAVKGGADRIELCAALELGGLTPSPALIERAVASGLPIHAMIRPRSGDFIYSTAEADAMLDDARHALALGAAGIVVGASRPDGRLNAESLARFREVAEARALVLHRAIDLTPDPVEAVRLACALKFDAVLSSGGALAAPEGAHVLKKMVEAADGRLSVMAGAGVNPSNVARLVRESGVREVHASASTSGPTPPAKAMWFGFAAGPRRRTDVHTIRQLREALDELAVAGAASNADAARR